MFWNSARTCRMYRRSGPKRKLRPKLNASFGARRQRKPSRNGEVVPHCRVRDSKMGRPSRRALESCRGGFPIRLYYVPASAASETDWESAIEHHLRPRIEVAVGIETGREERLPVIPPHSTGCNSAQRSYPASESTAAA